MSGNNVCPDGAHSKNAYPWQREIGYSIASWGKTLSEVGEYISDGDGKFVHDAYNDLVQELSLAILEAGKRSGNKVSGDPYCRDGKLNPQVVEICKRKIRKLKKKAFAVIEWPKEPEEREDLEAEIGQELDEDKEDSPEDGTCEGQELDEDGEGPPEDGTCEDQESVCTVSTVPLNRPDGLPDPRMETMWQEVEDRTDITTVRSLLKYLPEEQQQVLGLYYLNGGSFRNVAETLGKDEKQVRRIHERAIESLRTWMRVKPKDI